MTLRIQLFQTLQVSNGRIPTLDMGSPTTRSLFAYLVLHHQQAIDRRRLAFRFWPRGSEQAARRNLRQYLHRIRQALEPIDPDGRFLTAEGHYVQFQPPEDWFLDTAVFEQACTPPHENLSLAIQLYSGDLLEDLYDDWVLEERERLARLYRQALLRQIDREEAAGNLSAAVEYAQKYRAAEPLLENAYLRLMRLHYTAGDRARLKQTYDQLSDMLAAELDVAPLPETAAAYQAMLIGDYPSPHPPKTLLPHPHPPTPSSPYTPFVGRTTELTWLTDSLTAAEQGHGRFCFILGESGVGKTRLIDEWTARLGQPVYLFRGRGHEFEAMIPYSPLAQALREGETAVSWEYFRPPPPWLGALQPLLPDLPARFPGYSLTSQHHVIEGLTNFLLTLSRQRPVILIVDNLHWADAPTWHFLGYLSQHGGNGRILTIVAARPEDIPPERQRLVRKMEREQWQTRRLLRLNRAETETLVRQLMSGEKVEPVFFRRIYEETEGNPFFIIETIRAVREAGGDWTESVPTDAAGHRPHFAIPLQVQAVIESRLDKLDEKSGAALGVAAAIGREFSFDLLQQVSQQPTEELLDALDEWLARGLVRETGDGYDFSHEKLSQVAYQRLSRARRQWVHLQIADYLARHPATDPAQLAHHYYRSSQPDKALPWLARAGERALRVRSYNEAREFGLQAIGLLGRFPALKQQERAERIDLNLQLAQAYAFTGQWAKASQLLQETERMAEASGDLARLARIFYRSAQIFWLQSQAAVADDYARRVLRHAEELDDADLRLAALRMLGRVNIVLSQYDDAIAYLLRYVDLAEKEWAPPDLPVVYGYLGVAYARVGSWQRAIAAAQRGVDLSRAGAPGATRVVARMQLAFVYAELREWQQALATGRPVADLWREEGITPHSFMLRVVMGRCQAQLADVAAGIAEIEAALRWADEMGYRVMVHAVTMYLAQAQAAAGEWDVGLRTAVKAQKLAEEAGDLWATAVSRRVQAEIEMRRPRPDWLAIEDQLIRARDRLRQIRARPDLARVYLTLRRLYDRAGQMAWAVDCHFRAVTIFEELGMDEERRQAQGQAAGERTGAVVISGLPLRGPNLPSEP